MKQMIFTILVLVGITAGVIQAQPTVLLKTMNELQTDANSVQFDVYVENTGAAPASYLYTQIYFNYTASILNGGTASCAYVGGSDLPASHTGLLTNFSNTTLGRLGISYSAAPLVVNELTIPVAGSIKIGRFEFSTSAAQFTEAAMGKIWRPYSGSNPKSKYFYVNSGVAVELTIAANYTYSVGSEPLLPVELSSFSADGQGRNVNLSWVTKTEINTSSFQVERTVQGTQNWSKVGEVTASGNSSSPKEYSFTDKKLNSGKYSYRLKMVDNDGTFDYSKVVEIEVSLPKEYAISQNYPNPFNPTSRIDYQLPFDSKVTLDIYGITGEKVATIINGEFAAGYYTTEVNAGALNLASGVYVYRMSAVGQNNQNFVQVKKLKLTK